MTNEALEIATALEQELMATSSSNVSISCQTDSK